MKKLLITLLCATIIAPCALAKTECLYKKVAPISIIYTTCPTAKQYQELRDEVRKERLAISNALQLTDQQAETRDKLVKQNSQILEEKFYNFHLENRDLILLKKENASKQVIQEQEQKIETLKSEIDKIVAQENKEYKKLLNRDQRAKLRMIRKLQRKSYSANKHQKDYKKLNPKMREFAPKRV